MEVFQSPKTLESAKPYSSWLTICFDAAVATALALFYFKLEALGFVAAVICLCLAYVHVRNMIGNPKLAILNMLGDAAVAVFCSLWLHTYSLDGNYLFAILSPLILAASIDRHSRFGFAIRMILLVLVGIPSILFAFGFAFIMLARIYSPLV